MLEVKEVQTLSEQEKTVSLFEFIKELNKLKQKVVLNIRDYPWHLAISDIPVFSEYINVSYRDRVEEESETADDLLMPGMDISSEDILTFLKNRNVHYVDKRSNGGALWIIGGHELDSLVAEAKNTGILFHFKMGGGNVTKGKDGWWFK